MHNPKTLQNKDKARPFSSKPVVSTIPIYIDQNEMDSIADYSVAQSHKVGSSNPQNKNKLSQIIPQLPAFGVNSKSSALLYSKFIVKGLKNDKIGTVKNALRKKEEVTQTGCTQQSYVRRNKRSETNTHTNSQSNLYVNKNMRASQSAVCGKQSRANQLRQDETEDGLIGISEANAYVKKTGVTVSYDRMNQSSKNRHLMRSSSAKVFRKSNNREKPIQTKQQRLIMNTISERDEPVLKKVRTQKTLTRPQTAKQRVNINKNHQAQQELAAIQNKDRYNKNNRPSTAKSRQNRHTQKVAPQYENMNYFVNQKLACQRPFDIVSIRQSKFVDYIQKNKKNLASSRKSSIYLTNAYFQENNNLNNITQDEKRVSQDRKTKVKSKSKSKTLKIKMQTQVVKQQQIQQIKPQQIFTKKDKREYEKTLHNYQDYFQKVMPMRASQLRSQISKPKVQVSIAKGSFQKLQSKILTAQPCADEDENAEQKQIKNEEFRMTDQQMVQCFKDYIQGCQIMQFAISEKIKQKTQTNQQRNILDFWECQDIIKMGKQLKQISDFLERTQNKKKQQKIKQNQQIKQKIFQIIKKLQYFKQKSLQDHKKWLQLPFQIVVASQSQIIIESNSQVQYLYIILNGSVVKQRTVLPQNSEFWTQQQIENEPQNIQQLSLFDGQSFGQPIRLPENSSKNDQLIHSGQVSALQQTLLLRIPYKSYTKKFLSGSQIEQKMKILKLVFDSELDNRLVTEQDLQMISLSLQKHQYNAKSLIFRKGEPWDQFILVKKGKLLMINQYIMQRKRHEVKDMKKRDQLILKSTQRQSNQKSIKSLLKTSKGDTKKENVEEQQLYNTPFQECQNSDYREPLFLSDRPDLKYFRKQNLINYELIKETQSHLYYYYINEIKQFIIGDCINWQMLSSQANFADKNKQIQNNKRNNQDLTNSSNMAGFLDNIVSYSYELAERRKPSQFSLMANSQKIQIYTLSRNSFRHLPSQLKKILINKAKNKSQTMKQNIKIDSQDEVRNWDKYKQKICKNALEDKKNRTKNINNWV